MTAYDYDKQQWVGGQEGNTLRAKQLGEFLALLTGPKGSARANYLGINRAKAIQRCKSEIWILTQV